MNSWALDASIKILELSFPLILPSRTSYGKKRAVSDVTQSEVHKKNNTVLFYHAP